MKKIIKSLLANAGLELRRKDSSLPMLHQIKLDELSFPFWITNSHAKSWWNKRELEFNAEFAFIKKCASPGYTAFDIGAHHGIQTLPMALWGGNSARIVAFEANKENTITLQANINLNQLDQCRAIYGAVATENGTINVDGERITLGGIQTTSTPAYGLDQYCKKNDIHKVDFLKIDVEGFEAEVLAGAKNILKSKPHISLELHIDDLDRYGSSVGQTLNLIDWSDYQVSAINRDASWSDVHEVNSIDDLPDTGIINLFFYKTHG